MEHYFSKFRKGIIGHNCAISTPIHDSINLLYADWTASGRMYLPIEERLATEIFPYVANTHTDTNYTGSKMTYAYHKAREILKEHVGANEHDVLISCNSGMTGVVNKLQRILGLKVHESLKNKIKVGDEDRPIVFITHMEHHSNQTSWLETLAEVVIVEPDESGRVSVDNFRKAIKKHEHRKTKIAAITACSNVTGLISPYLEIAELIHQHDGLCFVDFACSAPYVSINMHPDDDNGQYLDAIYFSPHKFLGGPGSTGILIFNKKLYANAIPDHPGGGTVEWTNPWGEHKYIADIETREDGGTPPFLQTIKAAMCAQLKDEMGVDNIHKREEEILALLWAAIDKLPNVHVLANKHRARLGIISFYIDDLHYNLAVKMLNDRFGIQTRGGCSCAGTYGHYLLNVTKEESKKITDLVSEGNYTEKPGWIRLSIHPTQSNAEIEYLANAITQLAENHELWAKDYKVDLEKGIITPLNRHASLLLEKEVDACLTKPFTS